MIVPKFSADKLRQLEGFDPNQPARHARRTITRRSENIIKSVNALHQKGLREVCASQIRAVLDELGLNTTDRGNQWLGDVLGDHGLGLPRAKVKGKTYYRLPADPISEDLIRERYDVPDDWDWTDDADILAITPRDPQPATPSDEADDDPGAKQEAEAHRLHAEQQEAKRLLLAGPRAAEPEGVEQC